MKMRTPESAADVAGPVAAPSMRQATGPADHRSSAAARRQLIDSTNHSARVLQQKTDAERVNRSPKLARQPTSLRSNSGLPLQLKASIEALSGISMDGVQVHRDSTRPAQLNAHAYAQGDDIHLAAGQERHLPHEAWHVVQQRQGRVAATAQLHGTALNDQPMLEREADVMGSKALQMASHSPPSMPTPGGTYQARHAVPVQRVLRIKSSSVPEFTVLKFGQFQSLHKRAAYKDMLTGEIWGRLKAMATSKNLFEYDDWGDAISAAGGLGAASLQNEVTRQEQQRSYAAQIGKGIHFKNVFVDKGNEAGSWYTPVELQLFLSTDANLKPQFANPDQNLAQYVPLLAPGISYNRQTLSAKLYDIHSHVIGGTAHNKMFEVANTWFNQAELTQAMEHDRHLRVRPELFKLLPEIKVHRFKNMQELYVALLHLDTEKKKAALLKQRAEVLAAQRAAEERRNARPTSMAAYVDKSQELEQMIGQTAASHPKSMAAAHAMALKVDAFIEQFHQAKPQLRAEKNLYASIGTTQSNTSGAVGKTPEVVREALLNGTLQEKLTHILNFRSVLAEYLVGKDKIALEIATNLGFSPRLIALIAAGKHEEDFNELAALKEALLKKNGDPERNTQTVTALRIPFSDRERALWSDREKPEFGVGHTAVTPVADHEWVENATRLGFPVKSGPSTHTYELFETLELLGIERVSVEDLKLAAMGYLMPIGAHSLIEIQHTAEMFGADKQKSAGLYGRTLHALGIGQKLAVKTGLELQALLRDKASTPVQQLTEAHHALLSHGYVFIGYHGTDALALQSIFKTGFDESKEKRKPTDSWRGVYVAPTIEVAKGYIPDQGGLLRVYAPAAVVAACVQARLPLDDVLSKHELAQRLGMREFIPNARDHLIVGRENSQADNAKQANSLEAILSWNAARQCIALPSLHTKAVESESENLLANDVTMSSVLSFEEVHSSGGLNLDASRGKEDDPAVWKPGEAQQHVSGAWTEQWAAYNASAPSDSAPTRREIEILKRIGFAVHFGLSWAEVGNQTLAAQMNTVTMREMLNVVRVLPVDSPAWGDFVAKVGSAKEYSQVLPGIFLSGWRAAMDIAWQEKHVGAVMNCCQFSFPHAKGVQYESVNVDAYSNGMFEWTSNKIESQHRRGMLVHCIEGKNRSATVLTAYVMKSQRWNAAKAARFVMAKRPWAEPDIGALLNWEKYLLKMGYFAVASTLYPHPSKGHGGVTGATTGKAGQSGEPQVGPLRGVDPEWVGMEAALAASLVENVSPLSLVGGGAAIGLNHYMTLHNASGRYNNCLIYSVAGALGMQLAESAVDEIGVAIRLARVGVERNGFLNAQAIPGILARLGRSGTRVVLIDTTGRVESAAVGATPTFAAEIVNSGDSSTIVVVNQRFIHFGWGTLRPSVRITVFANETGDGSRWIQFDDPNRRSTPERSMVRSAMPIHRTVTADMARRIFHLGSEEQASQTTLRGLYLKLALQWHPDKNQDPNAAQQFLHVKAAYDLLRKGGKDDDPDGEGEGGEYLT